MVYGLHIVTKALKHLILLLFCLVTDKPEGLKPFGFRNLAVKRRNDKLRA